MYLRFRSFVSKLMLFQPVSKYGCTYVHMPEWNCFVKSSHAPLKYHPSPVKISKLHRVVSSSLYLQLYTLSSQHIFTHKPYYHLNLFLNVLIILLIINVKFVENQNQWICFCFLLPTQLFSFETGGLTTLIEL